jgi:hypothetical protein
MSRAGTESPAVVRILAALCVRLEVLEVLEVAREVAVKWPSMSGGRHGQWQAVSSANRLFHPGRPRRQRAAARFPRVASPSCASLGQIWSTLRRAGGHLLCAESVRYCRSIRSAPKYLRHECVLRHRETGRSQRVIVQLGDATHRLAQRCGAAPGQVSVVHFHQLLLVQNIATHGMTLNWHKQSQEICSIAADNMQPRYLNPQPGK